MTAGRRWLTIALFNVTNVASHLRYSRFHALI
jgi:hypothetical protein